MSSVDHKKIIIDGLWQNNPGLIQLLGLCPLLAVSATMVNAMGLGLATLTTLVLSNMIVSAIRSLVTEEIRLPVFMIVIASTVTAIEILMNAYFHELYLVLGIFIPLIVTNCVIIGRAEAFASRNSLGISALDGLMMGLGFTLVLLALGGMREILGQGTLMANAEIMFGPQAAWLTVTVLPEYRGFLLALLPPGAFIGLGLLIAIKNIIDKWLSNRASLSITQEVVTTA